jgi:hypothetical protein
MTTPGAPDPTELVRLLREEVELGNCADLMNQAAAFISRHTSEDRVELIAKAIFRSFFADDEEEYHVAHKWEEWTEDRERAFRFARAALAAGTMPIDMLLYCPRCGLQHVDAPDERDWTNPPRESHLCHGCGCIWRPADVPTNGVAVIQTRGTSDNWPQATTEIGTAHIAGTMPSELSSDDVRDLLRSECEQAGGQKEWAAKHNVSASYVCDVLQGRREPGCGILGPLKLTNKVVYLATNQPENSKP